MPKSGSNVFSSGVLIADKFARFYLSINVQDSIFESDYIDTQLGLTLFWEPFFWPKNNPISRICYAMDGLKKVATVRQ